MVDHLYHAKHATVGVAASNIYNMDETPVYIDMASNRTIAFQGEKSIEIVGTGIMICIAIAVLGFLLYVGHSKTRFTVVLLISADGKFHKIMVIIKGRKTVPNVRIPKCMCVAVSKGGSMNEELMLRWVNVCLAPSRGIFNRSKGVLFSDEHGSHKHQSVKDSAARLKIDMVFIPPKMTSYGQPLDVGINAPFKCKLKSQWEDWMSNADAEFTPAGTVFQLIVLFCFNLL